MNEPRRPVWVRLIAAACLSAFAGVGCHSAQHAGEQAPIKRGATPTYAAVADAYNHRVARLERLSCPVGLTINAFDNQGVLVHEQLEGNLQCALPNSFALRLDKVGQSVFVLGSNQKSYWWFDLTKDPRALVGTHVKATPKTVAEFGLPVHPLDLIEVLGISPLPGPDSPAAKGAKLEWSPNGRLLGLTLSGRGGWGARRFWLNPANYEPARIELLGAGPAQGAAVAGPVVAAALSNYSDVDVDGDARVHPRMAKTFEVNLPAQKARATLTLVAPRNPGNALRVKSFDLPGVLKYYKIEKIIDIDEAGGLDRDPIAPPRADAGKGSQK